MIEFKTEGDLMEFLDSLHESEGGAVSNRKWEPAQRALAALRASSDEYKVGGTD